MSPLLPAPTYGKRIGVSLLLVKDEAALPTYAARAGSGWFDLSTLKEPYRIEGKKTIGLEIVEQLGWRTPDVIVYPTGSGVGIFGIARRWTNCSRWAGFPGGCRGWSR